jgi:hypothetical protein
MLVACDVDRGEVFPGHRLVVRGLRHDVYSDDDRHSEYMDHCPGSPCTRWRHWSTPSSRGWMNRTLTATSTST